MPPSSFSDCDNFSDFDNPHDRNPSNTNNPGPALLPYYLANYKGRAVAIKRESDYQATIKLLQKYISDLRSIDPQGIIISAALANYEDVLAQVTEEIWPDVVNSLKAVEIALDQPSELETAALRSTTTKSIVLTSRSTEPGAGCADTRSLPSSSAQTRINSTKSSTKQSDPFSIQLRTVYRHLIDLSDLQSSMTVSDVKTIIENKYGIPFSLIALQLQGGQLDDGLNLGRAGLATGVPVDLVLNTRKSVVYLLPAYEIKKVGYSSSYCPSHLQNVTIEIFVNRKWELLTLEASPDHPWDDCIQSSSWTVSVSSDTRVFDHGSKSETYWLPWDGIASHLRPRIDRLADLEEIGQITHPVESYRQMLDLSFSNSVAVPFKDVEKYVRRVFESSSIQRRELLWLFLSRINSKPCSYLAIRFLSQTEYRKTAIISTPSHPDTEVIHVALLYRPLDPENVPLWNTYPPHQEEYSESWQDAIDPKRLLKKRDSERTKPIVVDFTFLEVP